MCVCACACKEGIVIDNCCKLVMLSMLRTQDCLEFLVQFLVCCVRVQAGAGRERERERQKKKKQERRGQSLNASGSDALVKVALGGEGGKERSVN